MRIRTILLSLLAVYAVVSTVYFVFHSLTSQNQGLRTGRNGGSVTSQAGVDLPAAPPFTETNQAKTSGPTLLARVQLENELQYTDLQSFVCKERMDRFKGHLNGDGSRQIDTVNAQVSFENGIESYAAIQQNKRQLTSLSSVPGAWSEGEFGTLLRQSRTLLATQPVSLKASSDVNGEAAVVYSMEISAQDSPWELQVGAQSYRVPFKTDVSVSTATGRILEIMRTSRALPSDARISEIQWSVALSPIKMDGKVWLLPTTGLYSVLYQQSNHREWNVISFSDYHHYAANSVMHF